MPTSPLDIAIAALIARTDGSISAPASEAATSNTTLPRPTTASSKPTLQTLPAEVRDRIFELALFHWETNGIISPVSDSRDRGLDSTVLIGGERFAMRPVANQIEVEDGSGNLHQLFRPLGRLTAGSVTNADNQAREERARLRGPQRPFMMAFNSPDEKQEWQDEADKLERKFDDSANTLHNHDCTLHCLIQPPLTRVNRKTREEALCIFYDINHFHFEMANHQTAKHCFKGRMPSDWWRAIGDTNLHYIHHLSIVCQPVAEKVRPYEDHHGTLERHPEQVPQEYMVNYNKLDKQRRGTVTFSQIDGNPKYGEAMKLNPVRHNTDKLPTLSHSVIATPCIAEWTLTEDFDLITRSGPNVRALECVVAKLEPKDARYLRDYAAMEDNSEVMARVRAREEEL